MVAEVPTSSNPAQPSGAYAAAAATVASPAVDERGRYVGAPTYPRRRRNPALVTFLVLLGLAAVIGLSQALDVVPDDSLDPAIRERVLAEAITL